MKYRSNTIDLVITTSVLLLEKKLIFCLYSFCVWQNCHFKQIYVSLFDWDSIATKHMLTCVSVVFSPFPPVAAAGAAGVGCPAVTAPVQGRGGRGRGERKEGGGGGWVGGREGGTGVS